MAHIKLTRSEQFLLIQRIRDPHRPADRATGRRVQTTLAALEDEILDAAMDAARVSAVKRGEDPNVAGERWLKAPDAKATLFRFEKDVIEFIYDDVREVSFPRHLAKIWVSLLDKVDESYKDRERAEPTEVQETA